MSHVDTVINSSVKNLVEFVKQKVQNNIVEANNKGLVDLNETDLEKIVVLVDSSVSQALALGYADVEAGINRLKRDFNLQ